MSRPALAAPPNSVAVIGGGIIGMSIAWRLAQQGWSVTVFEKSAIGGEASWAGAGMLSPGGEIDGPSPLATLAVKSRELFPAFVHELEQVSGIEIDYQECGALELAYSADELNELDERAEGQQVLGISSKRVTREQAATFWPRIRAHDLAGARFYPGDAIVNPRDTVAALRVACESCRVRLLEQCEVTQLDILSDAVELQFADQAMSFDAAVLAAGAWSSLLAVHGVPELMPAEPIKGHLVGYAQPDQTCNTILRHGHTYLLQRANGLLIAGASVEQVGFDRSIRTEIAADLAQQASFLLPHLAETSPTEVWTGFRPGSTGLQVGRWESDRFYCAYGHYRNGILLAPATAEEIAEAVSANLGRR